MEAAFSDEAHFDGATFSDFADFKSATFGAAADFSRANFTDWAIFERATFRSEVSFVNAIMEEQTEFSGAVFEAEPPNSLEPDCMKEPTGGCEMAGSTQGCCDSQEVRSCLRALKAGNGPIEEAWRRTRFLCPGNDGAAE